MIITQKLSKKEKAYLLELANKICNPPIQIEVLNSLRPGVLEYSLHNSKLSPTKYKIIEKILSKIIHRNTISEGEFTDVSPVNTNNTNNIDIVYLDQEIKQLEN